MKLLTQNPKKALKAFLKDKPLRSDIDVFKSNLIALLDKIGLFENRPKDESEEHLKNNLRDFLRDTYYKDSHAINTKDKKDLVIHIGKTTDSEVGIIIEAKRPTNVSEFISAENPNKKALHELILYYLDERQAGNNQLKQLVMTNVHEWFIIDANLFDKHIYRNSHIKKLYETKLNDRKDNPFFYEEISKIIAKIDVEIPCVYFDIRKYDAILRNNQTEDDRELIALFKIFSPMFLLKIASPNDSNSLNERFYKELLHIIGLEEAKVDNKNIIRRKIENRNAASLIELAIESLITEEPLHHLPDQSIYGETKDERIFNVALELCITWINRILFLKLLEGQLITYHQFPSPVGEGRKQEVDFQFLNSETINDFDELFKLFHRVLAVNVSERNPAIKEKYQRVPYLNSSLFEISDLEDLTIKINALDNGGQLEILRNSVLSQKKSAVNCLPTLDYLFKFLDSYDFASEGAEDVQEDNKTIINASVLGKVFEKINGYKDGSIFTPAFITMYMCKQSIRLAVVEKFKQNLQDLGIKIENIGDIYELIGRKITRQQANEIINSLKICDPAVGSGHFLVSALNEIIAIKSELGVLMDETGKTLRDYEIEIINDELIISDEDGNIFAYNPKSKESNRVQKTLFHEKQTIIENCLFGVDINPNSVKICRLRLWIELLKNAYYRQPENVELETLPNIDINIKCGNSLLSRFALNADLSKALKSIKYDVKAYRGFVQDYKNVKDRTVKRELHKIIDSIKGDFRVEILKNDPKRLRLNKLSGELFTILNQTSAFELTEKEKKVQTATKQKLEKEIRKLENEIEEIKSNAIYKNAFEWRFEFPEVLNNEGDFEGFDVVIGNPPYLSYYSGMAQDISEALMNQYLSNYEFVENKKAKNRIGTVMLFLELSTKILKPNGEFCNIIDLNIYSPTFMPIRKYLNERVHLNFLISDIAVFENVGSGQAIFSFTNIGIKNSRIKFQKGFDSTPQFVDQSEICSLNSYSYFFDKTQPIINKIKSGCIDFEESANIISGMNIGGVKDYFLSEIRIDGTYHKAILSGNIFRYNIAYPNEVQKSDPRKHFIRFDKEIEKYILKNKLGTPSIGANDGKFKNEKLLLRRPLTGDGKLAAVFSDDPDHYSDVTVYIINKKVLNLKYLLAILNSNLASFYCQKVGIIRNQKGQQPQITINEFKKFPIKQITPEAQQPFIEIVDLVLSQKKLGQDTSELERKIDEMVYKLYELTEEEVKIVEGR